jgi:predicted nuclease of restriction endonuclease-like (RecB) superfamily
VFQEKDLEKAILRELETFIMELGGGSVAGTGRNHVLA